MDYHALTIERRGNVAWLALGRPHSANAPDQAMAAELADACARLDQDDDVLVVALTGTEQDFCVGVLLPPELSQESQQPEPRKLGSLLDSLRLAEHVARLTKPVVAAINGAATGQGLELALACDIRIAASTARFSLPHLAHGLLPWDGGTQRLTRTVGQSRALELLLTGREVDAREALAIGLVHQVVAPEALVIRAQAVAEGIAAHGPIAARYAKEAVWKGMDMPLEHALRLEADLGIILQSTRDRAEGIRSFLGKRPPHYEGR